MSNPNPHQADLAARFRNPRFIQVHFESPGIWRFICESLDRGTVRVLLNDDGQIVVMHADPLKAPGRPDCDNGSPVPRMPPAPGDGKAGAARAESRER